MSEEWRRGWHPEKIALRRSEGSVLVVGGGPAGLEAARAAGARGYRVTLAEATRELGGHLNRVTRLPGLSEWVRVRDWRLGQIEKLPNIEIFRESRLTAVDVLEMGFDHVIIATGAKWRRDGVGISNLSPIAGHDRDHVYSPDDIMSDAVLHSPIVIFDDDPYVIGGAIAEKLAKQGHDVTIVTPHAQVSSWTQFTYDIGAVHRRLVDNGVRMITARNLVDIGTTLVTVQGLYGEDRVDLPASSVVMVTMRDADNALMQDLETKRAAGSAGKLKSLVSIGDCRAPGLLSEAVFTGHEAARLLDEPDRTDAPFRMEQMDTTDEPPLPWDARS